jgi:hypothetical protein
MYCSKTCIKFFLCHCCDIDNLTARPLIPFSTSKQLLEAASSHLVVVRQYKPCLYTYPQGAQEHTRDQGSGSDQDGTSCTVYAGTSSCSRCSIDMGCRDCSRIRGFSIGCMERCVANVCHPRGAFASSMGCHWDLGLAWVRALFHLNHSVVRSG